MATKFTQNSIDAWKDSWNKKSISNTLGALGSGLTGVIGAGVSNNKIADTSEEEAIIDAVENTLFSSGSYNNLLAEFDANNMARASYNMEDVRGLTGGQMAGNTLKGVASGALAGLQVGGPWGAVAGAAIGLGSGLAGIFTGNRKAKRKAEELNADAKEANLQYLANFNNASLNTHNTMFNNTLLNMAAKGGKIYIKPENRGKFTEYCGGKVTAECIARGKRSSSPTIRKRATFADNARKWHHSLGGNLFDNGGLMFQHGGIFSNGITTINNGGTHEQNPFEGVQIGVDSQGVPNMVEEGEIIWNDYVFSNRLKPTKEFKDKYKLKGETFADIAKEMQKESEERPNDPISKSGLEDSMTKLMIEQEKIRSNSNKSTSKNIFSSGGNTSNDPEFLDVTEYLPWERLLFRESTELPAISKLNTLDKLAGRESKRALSAPVTKLEVPTFSGTGNVKSKNNFLRYAPVVGSALGVASDLIGTTNKPDYSNVNLIQEATNRITPVGYTPIGTYLSYTPFDKNYYSNKLAEQAGVTRRAIANQAINPGAAMAGLLAADYNAQTQLGGLFRQAEEYNQAQRERAAGFNRQTDAMNAEMAMKAAMANQRADELRLKSAMTQAQMKEQIDAASSAARSANLTNLFDNLGAVGKENFIMDMIENNPALLYNWLGEYKNSSACGGKINRKRRK